MGFLAVQLLNTTSDLTKWTEEGAPLFVQIFLLTRWQSGDLNNEIISHQNWPQNKSRQESQSQASAESEPSLWSDAVSPIIRQEIWWPGRPITQITPLGTHDYISHSRGNVRVLTRC